MNAVQRRAAVVLLVVTIAAAFMIAGRDGGPRSADVRARSLTEQIRCPVCDGLSVAASPSSTSRAIAVDIRRRVDAGETDAEIRAAYVGQYGSWILLTPPTRGLGALLWFLPIGGLVIGTSLVGFVLWRRSRRAPAEPDPTDRTMVAAARR